MKRIYLSGPIAGQTYDEANDWRVEVDDAFSNYTPFEDIECLSPMRGKDFLPRGRQLTGLEYPTGNAFGSTQGIVTRDRFDVQSCDVMLVNLLPAERTQKVSIGTMVELGWADAWRKPVVLVWNRKRNPHEHLFLDGLCAYQTNSLEKGIAICHKLLNF